MKAQVTKKLTQDLDKLAQNVSSILKKIASMGSLGGVVEEKKIELDDGNETTLTEEHLVRALKFAIA